jgi:folate-binding protein YgfZ
MPIPAPETELLSPGLRALLSSAAYAPLPDLGWIRITGEDRVRWLNGMATNNIADLQPGHGCYNFFLNAQGRILGDCTAFLLEDSIVLQTAADRIPALIAALDHFIIMDDVELTSLPLLIGIRISGPTAHHSLQRFGVFLPDEKGLVLNKYEDADDEEAVYVLRGAEELVPRFEIWGSPLTLEDVTNELYRRNVDAMPATPADLECLRILSGIPLYGTDIRNSDTAKDLPQETAQDNRALHFSKGCYLGQEIVERIRSRGQVHRTFTGFLLSGDLPPAGTPLYAEKLSPLNQAAEPAAASAQRPVGELTSIARIGTHTLALGYIRRETLEAKAPLTYPGGTATPTALPFAIPELRPLNVR